MIADLLQCHRELSSLSGGERGQSFRFKMCFTVGIKRSTGRSAGPDDRDHPHGQRNSANTIVDIAVRGTHDSRTNTKNLLDGFASVP